MGRPREVPGRALSDLWDHLGLTKGTSGGSLGPKERPKEKSGEAQGEAPGGATHGREDSGFARPDGGGGLYIYNKEISWITG